LLPWCWCSIVIIQVYGASCIFSGCTYCNRACWPRIVATHTACAVMTPEWTGTKKRERVANNRTLSHSVEQWRHVIRSDRTSRWWRKGILCWEVRQRVHVNEARSVEHRVKRDCVCILPSAGQVNKCVGERGIVFRTSVRARSP
jgi:hypothetical protein